MNQANNNPYRNTRIEFHILQSFPVTCLNRDDVGAPKTAVVGGSTRARVSSQCWKRHIRLAMRDLGVKLGIRTKLIHSMIADMCKDLGATDEQAEKCGHDVAGIFIKMNDEKGKKKKKQQEDASEEEAGDSSDKSDTLLFISESEARRIAEGLKENGFNPDFGGNNSEQKKKALKKKVVEFIGKPNFALDGLDIALFGRMAAQATTLKVEAASSFSHAISTHRVENEVEFFTALDDYAEEPGSAHMGSLEFNSATYYRYIDLDLGQLWQSLAGQHIPEAIDSFIKALYLAIPSARQSTQAGACPWEFARVYVRTGQQLQASFDTAVRPKNGGFIEPSKEALCSYLDKKEKLAGSLFGKKAVFDFGEDENFNVDKLIDSVQATIKQE